MNFGKHKIYLNRLDRDKFTIQEISELFRIISSYLIRNLNDKTIVLEERLLDIFEKVIHSFFTVAGKLIATTTRIKIPIVVVHKVKTFKLVTPSLKWEKQTIVLNGENFPTQNVAASLLCYLIESMLDHVIWHFQYNNIMEDRAQHLDSFKRITEHCVNATRNFLGIPHQLLTSHWMYEVHFEIKRKPVLVFQRLLNLRNFTWNIFDHNNG